MTKRMDAVSAAMRLIEDECDRVINMIGRPPLNSYHEGYALLAEEVDELWQEIKNKDHLRSQTAVLNEAVQVATVAIRIITDCCPEMLQASGRECNCGDLAWPERRLDYDKMREIHQQAKAAADRYAADKDSGKRSHDDIWDLVSQVIDREGK